MAPIKSIRIISFLILILYYSTNAFVLIAAPLSRPTRCTKGLSLSVDGIDCVSIDIALPQVGKVSILEATASAQEELVSLALEEDTSLDQNLTLPSGDPYGAVLWPASTTISRYLIEKRIVENKSVMELGCGTGLISIACSLAGARRILATDYGKNARRAALLQAIDVTLIRVTHQFFFPSRIHSAMLTSTCCRQFELSESASRVPSL